MVMLRLQSTCWLSSYLVDLRRKERNPAGSLPLSRTLNAQAQDTCRVEIELVETKNIKTEDIFERESGMVIP